MYIMWIIGDHPRKNKNANVTMTIINKACRKKIHGQKKKKITKYGKLKAYALYVKNKHVEINESWKKSNWK